MEWKMVSGNGKLLKGIIMKVNGYRIGNMGVEFSNIILVHTEDSFKIFWSMEKANKYLKMAINIKESTNKASLKVKDATNGVLEDIIRATSKEAGVKVMEFG